MPCVIGDRFSEVVVACLESGRRAALNATIEAQRWINVTKKTRDYGLDWGI